MIDAVVQSCLGANAIRFDAQESAVQIDFDDFSVPFSELSDGQRAVMAIVGEIAIHASRIATARDPKDAHGNVLIDELDLHLHPRWQREIVGNLRRIFPKIQFFATTHSPQIIGEVEPECITILEWKDGAVVGRRPTQSRWLDSSTVLDEVMSGARSRNQEAEQLLRDVEERLESRDIDAAREILRRLRQEMRGSDPRLSYLEGSADALEALKRAKNRERD